VDSLASSWFLGARLAGRSSALCRTIGAGDRVVYCL
jgi:hypothetical protein